MMWDGVWGWGWGPVGMIFGGLIMLIFWGGLIALIVWAVSRFASPGVQTTPRPPADNPLEIARTRYARGEISKEEFEQLKRDLTS